MFQISINRKIYAIIGLTGAFSLAVTFFLLGKMSDVNEAYNRVLATQVRQENIALSLSVTFKTQVQEWKNVLLRGHDPKDLEKYWTAFSKQEALVQKGARELKQSTSDPAVRSAVDE